MLTNLDSSPVVTKVRGISDSIEDTLCEMIIDGRLTPGQRLRENELAEHFGVSRTPVREALRKVEYANLISRLPNGVYMVSRWDKKTLWELATLRSSLDSLAIRLAIPNLTDADINKLEQLINEMEAMVQIKDYDKLFDIDNRFHDFIRAKSKHSLLQDTLAILSPQIRYFMAVTRSGDEVYYPETHRKLLAAIKSKDAKTAGQAMEDHILDTAQNLIDKLQVEKSKET